MFFLTNYTVYKFSSKYNGAIDSEYTSENLVHSTPQC